MIQFLWKLYLRITNPTCKLKASSFSRNVKFEDHVTIENGSHVMSDLIGRYTYINKYCLIDKPVKRIGRFCSIAYGVKLGLGTHPTDWVSSHPFAYDKKYGFVRKSIPFDSEVSKPTIIGNDVWIGANATVLAGVNVGDGAIIGAHALVSKDVEPYSIVIGSPAKHVRYRFDDDIIAKLSELSWWDWPIEKIKTKIEDFQTPDRLL